MSLAESLVSSYQGHIQAIRSQAIPDNNFPMEEYQGKLYPKNFRFCEASRVMWDMMLTVPGEVYPSMGSPTHMFRCSNSGLRMLQIQSIILGWELGDTQRCPSVAEMRAVADEYTQTQRNVSDFVLGTSARVICSRPSCIENPLGGMIAEPANTEAIWINGRDWGFFVNVWVKFMDVHVAKGLLRCNTAYTMRDPTGFTNKEFALTNAPSSLFQTMVLGFDQAFPLVQPTMWTSPYPLCPEYRYKNHEFPCTSQPLSGCNVKIVPPLETDCTMTSYENPWRIANLNALLPPTFSRSYHSFRRTLCASGIRWIACTTRNSDST